MTADIQRIGTTPSVDEAATHASALLPTIAQRYRRTQVLRPSFIFCA